MLNHGRLNPVSNDSSNDDDNTDFASQMSGVKRLNSDRINVYQQRQTRPIPVRSNDNSADDDINFSSLSFEQISQLQDSYFDHGIQKKQQRKMRQGQLPLDDHLDLHGCTQKMAVIALTQFFDHAAGAGHQSVIVIHGRGNRSSENAVLKPMVQHWLSQQKIVLGWCPAQAMHGGTGASYVYLRRGQKNSDQP